MRPRRVFHPTLTRLVLMVFFVVGMSSGAAPAVAHDHEPPRTALLANGETLQRGRHWSGCWTTGFPDGTFVTGCGDGFPQFPKVDVVAPGTRVTIRILKSQRPRDLVIYAWKKTDRYGFVSGSPEELSYKRRRVRLPGGVAWDFSFATSDPRRHYYVSVTGVWRDEEGAEEMQDASYAFHVRTSR
ncbi:MAG TPA: hypothetical protein VHI97_02505 [Actinomycetota bacterium]|nr:hypothetical protein [Actinomycetota bacterium]